MTTKSLTYRGLTIRLQDEQKGTVNVTEENHRITLNYPCISTDSCSPYIITFPRGFFQVHVYGASGGNANIVGKGGLGGFSQGDLRLISSKTLFLFIGGKGTDYIQTQHRQGGYNGGGSSFGQAGGGGGATDFRTNGGTIDSEESISSRILIAGGGGGARYIESFTGDGGKGGGLEGGQGEFSGDNTPCYPTQVECIGGSGSRYADGTKWKGADGDDNWGTNQGGGGAGGGLIGGGTCADCSGSGGSGGFFTPITNGQTFQSTNEGNGKAVIYIFNELCSYSCIRHYAFLSLLMNLVCNKV